MAIDGDVTFSFDKIPQGQHVEFTIDFIIDTGTPPTVTLDPRVINPPTLPTLSNGLRVVMHFEGVRDDTSTRFTFIGGTTSVSGLTEPIVLSVTELTPLTSPTTTDIAWNITNPQHITIDRNITFAFTDLPASGSYGSILVIIDIDGTGGFDTPIWPASVANAPTVSTTANTRTSVLLYTINGGTVVTNATSVGSSSGGGSISQWATFSAVADVNFATFDGLNIDRLRFVVSSGAPSSAADPSIFLDSSANMVHNVAGLKATSFKSNNVEIAKFIEAASTVYRLDMLAHSVHNAKDILIDDSAGAVTFAGTAPALGFDSGSSRLILNMPAGANLFITNNNVIGSTQMNNNSISANIINASDVLQLGVDVTVPTVVGEFRSNGTDVTVFSGGSVINFSNLAGQFSDSLFRIQDNADATKQLAFEVSAITTGTTRTITIPNANTALVLDTLANLAVTAINVSLLFGTTGLDIGDSTNPVDNFFVNQVRLQPGTIVTNKPMITSVGGNSVDINHPTGSSVNFTEQGGTAGVIIDGGGLVTTNNAIIKNTLTINNSSTNPASDGQFTRNVAVVGLQADSFDVRRDSIVVSSEPAEIKLRKLANSITSGTEIATVSFQTGITTATTWGDIGVGTLVGSGADASFLSLRVRADNGLITAVSFQGDDNNQRVQMLMGGTSQARIQPSFDRMGYFVTPQVTNFSLVIGTAGSIEIPVLSNGSPSVTDLNQAFGSFDNAFGYESVDERFYVRESATRWVFFDADGAVT